MSQQQQQQQQQQHQHPLQHQHLQHQQQSLQQNLLHTLSPSQPIFLPTTAAPNVNNSLIQINDYHNANLYSNAKPVGNLHKFTSSPGHQYQQPTHHHHHHHYQQLNSHQLQQLNSHQLQQHNNFQLSSRKIIGPIDEPAPSAPPDCYSHPLSDQPPRASSTIVDLESHRFAPVARSSQQQSDNTVAVTPYQYHNAPQHYCPPILQTNYQISTNKLLPAQQHRPYYTTNQINNRYTNPNVRGYYFHNQLIQGQHLLGDYSSTASSSSYYPTISAQSQTKPMSVQSTTSTTPGPKLIWLLFMHRHGDRAPLNMAPRDKYNNISYWAEGFGNLNNAGRMRMFKVGKFIRRRYDGFLSDNIREVYSRSSDVDRCIESSHALLAGLYPPTNRFEWNKELLWLPAPVHTVPAPEDYLLNEAGRKFLMEFINEIHLVQNSDAVKKLYEESVNERELLERELGYEYDMFYKFKCTYSTLDIEERNGLTMPAWYTPELKQKLYRFAGIAFGLAGGGTEKLKKIRCGHLLDDIVSRMEMSSIEGPKLKDHSEFNQPTNAPTEIDDRKIVHYSTHDSIMAAFLEALNINTPYPVPPGFGATFFVELYVDLNEQGLPVSEKYIKLFYMDDTDSEKPIEKKLPNVKLNEKGQLTLNNFKKYISHLLPSTSSCSM